MGSITAEEGAALGLKAPSRSISAEEGAQLGLKAPSAPAVPPAEKKDPLADYPVTAFALGSANKLAMGGGSAALALKDMLKMVDSRTGQNDQSKRSAQQLYLDNKKFYDEGFDRLGKANPKADFLSNAAYFVGPGSPLKAGVTGLMARGAVHGAGQAALGGDKSFVDDPEAALKETAAGGALGAGASLLGMIPGKVLEAGGNMARGALSKVLNKVNSEAISEHASQLGSKAKQAQEAVGGLENLHLADEMKWAGPQAPAFRGLTPRQVNELLARRQGNAHEKIADFFNNPKQVESMKTLIARGMQNANEKATGAVKDIAVAGALGLGGGEVADKLGLDKKWGYAIGGAAPLWFLRNAAAKVLKHPDSLQRLVGMKGVGQALAQVGARGAGGAGTDVALAVMAKKDPNVERALAEEYSRLPVDAAGEVPDQR